MDYQLPVFQSNFEPIVIVQKVEEPESPKPVEYIIDYGDSLTKIAEAHSTSVERLWSANPQLTSPDLIEPEKPLRIPQADEILEDRPMPEAVTIKESISKSSVKPLSRGFSVSGNTYTPGQCTWGVKTWRPDIPNGWGNATTWLSRARAQGWSTGSTPRVGAVAWTSGHVALVVGVNGSKVTIKEMNYNYVPYSVRTVERPASKYSYIY